MRIAYIHGFASSGQTNTANVLRRYFPEDEVFAYDMPVSPRDAIVFLNKQLRKDKIDIVFGTSLGAYYVLQTKECYKVALNPPFDPNRVLDQFIGQEVEFLNPREQGEKNFLWHRKYHRQIIMLNENIVNAGQDLFKRTKVLFAKDDDFVTDRADYPDVWDKQIIAGGHRCTEEMFIEYIKPEIEHMKMQINKDI